MTNPFEYDVFLSFSSADEEVAKPIWQELCSNGLRVFWSDATLRKEVGNSWFEVIEKSLEQSKHMLLICSDSSMNSKWVQREYRAFFDYCYSSNSRRLIPLLTHEFKPNNLPLFLRQLQVGKINDPQFIREIIPILGGVNIEMLQNELQSLKEKINLISIENELLNKNSIAIDNKFNDLSQENMAAKKQIEKLSSENTSLKERIDKFSIERSVLNKKVKEKGDSLSSENILLNEQIAKLTNEINVLNEKITEQEDAFSSENASLKKQLARLKSENNLSKESQIEERTQQRKRIGWPRLVVSNLAKEVSSSDLWMLFGAAGSIKLSQIIKDEAGHSMGIGLIVMSSYVEAEKAIGMFHEKDYDGNPLRVYQIT